ncbi:MULTISPECIES: BREX-2 system ATPase PglY [unclassified Streptomyces]|uniref:BREX-2 system ATPase PglY n=1 Tax=unclassified Streptomyces TaxID=2593676 RepID=UPI00224CB0A9|nr:MULTISPECIES: phage resistance protein [unclassified Streptomyces]MCX4794333.1 phage resistance protein [Streptomyces sp. NBC_01242]WSP62145.1 phage resistance protein [Streptomyces sp. NBC_01240]WSU21232.1 phage resistance protein [Streptomyces sp. NBC_01108]
MAQQPPLLRDVIDIKESLSTSDFVLQLSEATTPEGAERALRDYVVTERLRDNFDEALGLIKAALDGHTSKAAYLHGSFGSGKSHFMAVLHALLSGSPAARSRDDLDPVLTKHAWLGTAGKNFLLVPYHMLGAKALEQRVLGGYVSHVKKLHPEAPTPQVYRTDALFDNIRSLRERHGDRFIIDGLASSDPDAADDDDEWGEAFAWEPGLLDTALAAEEVHESGQALNLVSPSTPAELRARLVEDASTNLLPGFTKNAAEDEHGFVSLDAGLSVIAEHAKSLGYDGLILFMDELILWLATLIHDQKFVAREASKITNFVEGGDARRAVPVVSFIARQRDLRELVGEEVSGAAESSIQDTLNLASGRFDKITLEDRNLPQVAHARLLTPKDAESTALVNAEFEKTRKVRQEVWDTLLGSDRGTDGVGADEESFRLTYPFSPAFMDTLVHVSSALQRNRTGMKLMGQLLADHRDELRLGDLIPVGDLYPLITAGGDKPFTDSLKVVFEAADKLYRTKLRPYLLGTYNVSEEDVEQYSHRGPDSITDPDLRGRIKTFVGDNRIVGTLLLSALAPSVPALADLTIRRLSALNYGSVVAPIPGREYGILKNKVAEWAGRFPEIKETGTDANPGVRLELTGVDVDSVIANAKVNDNPGNRQALAKRILSEELVLEHGQLTSRVNFDWRGTSRSAEVVFGNVADEEELPDHDLMPQEDGLWRIVVDLPYDESEYGTAEDVERMRRLREKQHQGERSRTVAWLPAHLSAQRYTDFCRLVVIDKALSDEQRFDSQYAGHLNADNRARAKGLLETQRESLLKNVKAAFKQAYGLAEKKPTDVELGFADHLQSLRDVDGLVFSMGQPLRDGLRHVAGKLLADQFPDHPDLDPENTGIPLKAADARKVFTHIQAAAEARDGRTEVPAGDRKLLQRIAGPLRLGQQKEAYFELSLYWADHFRQLARERGVTGDLSLITLTDWTDLPQPRGLPDFLSRLVVAAFAEMDDRVWVRGGMPLDPAPELSQIKDVDTLRSQPLPSEEDWDTARRRFETIFGKPAPTLRRGRMVNQFARQITEQARSYEEYAIALVAKLEEHAGFLHLDGTDESGRLPLARRSVELLRALTRTAGQGAAGAKKTVDSLAAFDLGQVGADRFGSSITQAKEVARALTDTSWTTLELAANEGPEGQALLDSLRNAAGDDQRTSPLPGALVRTQREVLALIKRNRAAATPPPPAPVAPSANQVPLNTDTSHPPVPTDRTPAPASGGTRVQRSGGGRTTAARAVAELQAEIADLAAREPGAAVEITWRVVES